MESESQQPQDQKNNGNDHEQIEHYYLPLLCCPGMASPDPGQGIPSHQLCQQPIAARSMRLGPRCLLSVEVTDYRHDADDDEIDADQVVQYFGKDHDNNAENETCYTHPQAQGW
jgi:hypothetical protein